MSAISSAVSFCLPMAQKKKTAQLGTRIDIAIKDRAERFCIKHPLQPSLAALIERALTDYLDRAEPELPKAAKPRKP